MQESKVEKMIFISNCLRDRGVYKRGRRGVCLRLWLMGFVEEGGKD